MEMTANIAEDLEALAFPIDKLRVLPGNPNKGDIPAVARSLDQFKQRKAIVAKHDGDVGIVIAGNTTLQAARDILGWTHVAVSWADDLDELNAAGFALADNQTGKLGTTDHEALAEMLEFVPQSEEVFAATGFDEAETEKMFREMMEAEERGQSWDPRESSFEEDDDDDEPIKAPEPRQPGNPVIQYALVFDTEAQQQRFFAFIRWLKKKNPEADTVAQRLDEWFDEVLPEDL